MVGEQYTCPVFHPTLKDVQGSFEEYITKIERKIAHAGVCKIVAPKGWSPRKKGYQDVELEISRPIRQHATGSRGVYRMLYIEQKPMSLQNDFKTQALNPDNLLPARSSSQEDIERLFWKNVSLRPPLYGADIEGSLFDEKLKGWNLRDLRTLLSRVLRDSGHTLPGVNTPYLYFGMWRSVFAWHTEDVDLYSINYLHYGAPKSWYCIPPAHRARFETMMEGLLPEMFRHCPEFLRHKELLVSPDILRQFQIPYVKVTQNPGEFIINYPGAYHAGFNHGYNCAESVNFGTKKWIPIGARAGVCCCEGDSVKIDMKMFIHLVPKRLLPAALLADSESSESDSEDAASSDADSEAEQPSSSATSSDAETAEGTSDDELSHESAGTAFEEDTPVAPKRRRPSSSASTSTGPRKRALHNHIARGASTAGSSAQARSTKARPNTAAKQGPKATPARGMARSMVRTVPIAVRAAAAPPSTGLARPVRAGAASRYQEARALLMPRQQTRSPPVQPDSPAPARRAASHHRRPVKQTLLISRSRYNPTGAEVEHAAQAAVAAVKAAVAVHGRTRQAANVFAGPSRSTRSRTTGHSPGTLTRVITGRVTKR